MSTTQSNPSHITPDMPLATIALRSDAHAAVLARHGLDFCCAGRRTLSQVCAASGLDVGALLSELDADVQARAAAAMTPDWNERPLSDVLTFIVDVHHAFTRSAIARITPLMDKVVTKHGEAHTELVRIAPAFRELALEMEPHMMREERVLFPYIRSLAQATPGHRPTPPFLTVRNPVRMMMAEHDSAAALLSELQAASDNFTVPAGGCTSYRALFAALAELRLDLLRHVSLENNVLFPRAIALEDSLG